MKKFTFKGVLDGFRSSVVNQQTRIDQEIVETLRSDNFQVTKTFRHGFPFQPTAVAFDPVQHLLAIGTKSGSLRILGGPGVDAHLKHEGDGAVIQIQFLTNEGALITATSDDVLHLWNFRQKKPEVVHSLKFQRERITYIFLPFQSKWFYVGTEKGNIHIVNIESFVLSGYIINWNKAIEVSRKTHPGAVVHLSDNPQDPSKLLIGYESGQIVLWDLRTKSAEMRWNGPEPLRSISWHHEGKQFICSHADGSLTTWNARQGAKPVSVTFPHAKTNKDGKLESCKPIQKVEWKSSRSTGEAYVIFSGGLPHDKAGRTPSISVVHGKTTTVLEMEQNVVDFMTLCENPYSNDFQDPYAIIVLLNNDLVAIDLLTPGYPCFENPYPMDLHESPVTCCTYLADCPSDLIPAFYSVGSRTQKKSGFSEREWPVAGGEWIPTSCSYNEIILTGHADGSIKFWDASAGTLQILYKLKSAKVFEKPRTRSGESGGNAGGATGGGGPEEDPFAIQLISLCPESRKLCVAGASSHVILFKFKKQESTSETHVLEIPISYEAGEETEFSPDHEYPPRPHLGSTAKGDSGDGDSKKSSQEAMFPLKVKPGPQKKQPGFQAHIICLTPWVNGEPPGSITALSINSSYGLMAYGNEAGIVIVDIVQKICLLNMGTPDLYGSADPYQRAPRSPKRTGPAESYADDRCRSPTDQTPNSNLLEPPVPDVTVISLSSPACNASHEWNKCAERSQTPGGPPCSSNNVSPQMPSPAEAAAEEGEEALAFVPDQSASAPAPEHPSSETTITSLHSLTTKVTIAKKASQTWKGFSLKKQLNRVKKNPLLPNREKATAGSLTPTEEPPPARDPEASEEDWTIVENGAQRANSDKSAEVVRTSDEAGGDGDARGEDLRLGRLSRPVDLPLFDNDGRPARPPRHQGQKKKSGSESKVVYERDGGGKRDARLLSVPNLKHQKQEQPSLRDLRRKQQATATQPSFGNLLIRHFNKLDSSFSRSRSSSMSSLENISSEAIQCLAFADSYTKKSDPATFPTLWIGTSLGSVLTIMISLPPTAESRATQPVGVSPWGTIFRLKGSVLTMSFLDCNGALIPYLYEPWKDENKQESRDRQKTPTKSNSNRMSPTLGSKEEQCGGQCGDRQFVVIVSEKQARVVALPSHNCVYRQQLADADFVVKAEIISLKDSVCLVCYVSSGHVTAYSLPSLRPLVDVDFLPLAHLSFQTSKQGILDPMLSIWGQQMFVNEDTDQIAKTFCFSNRGHGLYLCSPSEIQKFTVSSEFCASLNEMVRELFLPVETPEPPKASFFQGLFGGGTRQLDREELFGENSGKPSRSVAKHIPGPSANLEAAGRQVTAVGGEISRAHKLAVERGEKLGELEERTQRMMNEAENFANSAHGLMLKYKDKKWYQL